MAHPDSGTYPPYDAAAVEARWRSEWSARRAFATPSPRAGGSNTYLHAVTPFTSGRLHLGHARGYTIGDVYARFRRMQGDAVLFAIGFDAFGLPAELGAIAAGIPPSEWVAGSCAQMREQMQRLGLSFDWERMFVTSDDDVYRWSQRLFLELLAQGLVYRERGKVDWCDNCATTLAALQVEDGRCWRCGGSVRLAQRLQWRLRVTAFVAENDAHLERLSAWDDASGANQRSIAGRVDGVELGMLAHDGRRVTVFTPHRNAVAAARLVLISPRHPELDRWTMRPEVRDALEQVRLDGWRRDWRHADSVALIDTGFTARLPGTGGSSLPVIVSPLVDGRFGVTAVLAIPDCDRADAIVARRLGLSAEVAAPPLDMDVSGMRPARRFRVDDLSISRQRSWGAPIPIIECATCGPVPVPVESLPVRLPHGLLSTARGHALATCREFVDVSCPRCGRSARRETDTLDCHFDALWSWIPRCVPRAERASRMLSHPDLEHWLPARRIVYGADGGSFVFNQRATAKALRDLGVLAHLDDGEPFAGATMHEMVLCEGRKMSKHLGNVTDPDELVSRFGADALRLALLFAARPQKPLSWSDGAIERCRGFLERLWRMAHRCFAVAPLAPASLSIDPRDALRRGLEATCRSAVTRAEQDLADLRMQRAVRNLMWFFTRIEVFEGRARAGRDEPKRENAHAAAVALAVLVQLLTPLAPHVGEELWAVSGAAAGEGPVPWPEAWSATAVKAAASRRGERFDVERLGG